MTNDEFKALVMSKQPPEWPEPEVTSTQDDYSYHSYWPGDPHFTLTVVKNFAGRGNDDHVDSAIGYEIEALKKDLA